MFYEKITNYYINHCVSSVIGTWPLSILSKLFDWLSTGIGWLAKALNWFDWNGLLN